MAAAAAAGQAGPGHELRLGCRPGPGRRHGIWQQAEPDGHGPTSELSTDSEPAALLGTHW